MRGTWRYVLTFFGCALWLVLLAGALRLVRDYGFDGELVVLTLIPVAMIALTMATGWYLGRTRYPRVVGSLASIVAFFSALHWVGIWGAGV